MLWFDVILEKNDLELSEVDKIKWGHWVKKWKFWPDFFSNYVIQILTVWKKVTFKNEKYLLQVFALFILEFEFTSYTWCWIFTRSFFLFIYVTIQDRDDIIGYYYSTYTG